MAAPGERTPEEQEHLNRQLGELLQELRIAMPGVQVLFAFLLAVPFASGFDDTTAFERDVYLVALLSAALSSALLIAPTAYHRIMFERGEKERIVDDATRAAIIGLAFLAISMVASVLLVASYLFGGATAAISAGTVAVVFGWLWFGLGWWRRRGRPAVPASRNDP